MFTHRIITTVAITVIVSIAAAAGAQPAAAAVCTTSTLFPYLCQGQRSHGDSMFNASYTLRTGVATKQNWVDQYAALGLPPPAMADDYAWAAVAFTTDVTLFGNHLDFMDTELSGRNQNGVASARLLARAGGVTLIDQRYSSVAITLPLFAIAGSASEGFDWGVVSAEIEAVAIGGLTLALTASGGAGGFAITGTPTLGANVVFSADVQVGCSGSLDAGLTLLSLRTPMTATLGLANLASHKLDFAIDTDFAVDAVKGHGELNVDCYVGEWSYELFDYSGFHLAPINLYAVSRTIAF